MSVLLCTSELFTYAKVKEKHHDFLDFKQKYLLTKKYQHINTATITAVTQSQNPTGCR